MSRFHIYRLKDGRGYVIDLQANLLDDLKTRVVAPLLVSDQFAKPIGRLTPVLVVGGKPYFVAVYLMAAIPLSQLDTMILDASAHADELTSAIDFTFQGF